MAHTPKKSVFRIRCLSLKQVTWIQRLSIAAAVALTAMYVVRVVSILATPGTADVDGFDFAAMLVGFLLLLAMLEFNWLPDASCAGLADLCEQHPALADYRDKVRTAGRKFTNGEYGAIRRWAALQAKPAPDTVDAQRLNDGPRRLYGIARFEP